MAFTDKETSFWLSIYPSNIRDSAWGGGGGRVLLGILGAGVPPGSPNPDPISDQKMSFSTPIFRPDL